MPVSRASSMGSVRRLSLRPSLSSGYSFSIPAMDWSRLARRFRAVMAGSGFRVRECRESIMQWDRFRARRAVRLARLSGICVKRLDDRSRECSVLDRGPRLLAGMAVSALSARLRCFRNLHLDAGRMPMARRLDALPRGLCHESDRLEWELPDPDRLTLCEPRTYEDPLRELEGRRGELLRGLDGFVGDLGNSSVSARTSDGRRLFLASGSPPSTPTSLQREPTCTSTAEFRGCGEPGA